MAWISYPVALMYIATLAAGVGVWWLRENRMKKAYVEQIAEFRREVETLAASIGLMKRGSQIPKPPNFGGM
jgi:hypothetical protein